jgi:hypothetical protein
MELSGQLHAPAALLQREELPVSHVDSRSILEAFGREKRQLPLPEIGTTMSRSFVCSLVSILTELYQLLASIE